MFKLMAVAALFALSASPANAYDWIVEAHVTLVEPTYMPDRVTFSIDQNAGTCPAGSTLVWVARGSDVPTKSASSQGVLSTLISALVGQRMVRLYGSNSGCSIDFIHLL